MRQYLRLLSRHPTNISGTHAAIQQMSAVYTPLLNKCQRHTHRYLTNVSGIHRYSTKFSGILTAIRQMSAVYTPLFDKVDVHSFVHTTRACVRMFATRSKVESNTCIGGPARLLKELLDAMNVSFVLANRAPQQICVNSHHNSPAPQLSGIYYTAASLFCFAKAYNNARPLLSKGPATPGYPCAGRQPHPLNNQNKTSLNNENKKQSNGAAWVLTEVLANVRRKLRRLGRCLLILRLVLCVQCPCPSKALPLPLPFNGAVSSLAAMRSRFVKRT